MNLDTYEVGAAKKALLEIIEQAQEAEAIIASDYNRPEKNLYECLESYLDHEAKK